MNKDLGEVFVEAQFDHRRQMIFVQWDCDKGFGQSRFFVREGEMYCDSEYMSAETENVFLKYVYEKYKKPRWAKDTFINGHSRLINLDPRENVWTSFEGGVKFLI